MGEPQIAYVIGTTARHWDDVIPSGAESVVGTQREVYAEAAEVAAPIREGGDLRKRYKARGVTLALQWVASARRGLSARSAVGPGPAGKYDFTALWARQEAFRLPARRPLRALRPSR